MTDAEKIEALREWLGNHHSPCRCMVCIELLNPIRDIIDPPRAKWRELVDDARSALLDEFKQPPLPTVLSDLAEIADDENDPRDCLARIVAVAEAQVVDVWEADPEVVSSVDERWHTAWGILVALVGDTDNYEPEESDWRNTGRYAAHWLRSLTDEKPGTRTDAKYEHTLAPHCPVCFGVCAGSNRDGAA